MKLDRRNEIIDMISKQRSIKNTELMEAFDISIETVRRDLQELEQQGYLRRVYGGAIVATSLTSEPEYASRIQFNYEKKTAIAAEAAKFVRPGDAVYLGIGTTVQAMVQYLTHVNNLTFFTNALRTAIECSDVPNSSVYLSGGRIRPKELSLSGHSANENFAQFTVDKAFFGICGIDKGGVTDINVEEANLFRLMVKNARQSIILTDSPKLGLRTMVNVCPLEDIDIVITDDEAPTSVVKDLEAAGVTVILVKTRGFSK